MSCHIVDRSGSASIALDRSTAEERLRRGEFFWIDLHGPTDDELALLEEVFGFHPLAVEDSRHFGQRAKLDDYDDFVFLVVYGWSPDEDGLVEVHCFYSERFLVTIHRDEAPGLKSVQAQHARRPASLAHGALVLYQVVDALVDSFFPALAGFDERLDALEDELFSQPSDAQLQEIFVMKRRLVTLRKAIAPQRDLFGRLAGGAAELPAMTPEVERYFRDVYDHLIRLSEMIDTYRDTMTGTMDVYLSTASNRMNAVMKQLAVIATIFLPLTFITGFFGQNFEWMVEHVGSATAFFALGAGVQLAAIVFLLAYFKRRGWF